ncbi:MAG TPA: TetR/AcrR family transcriptional regulator [Acidimicrobiales bacterium]|nr:TetR/AcrR family transcriptional regulator [Acidimicrobiales bacterium]
MGEAAEPTRPEARAEDALREKLLDAAARVFARQGYSGTKILDVVREAGLSTGAVYGRFKSKNDLLREAVIRRTANVARLGADGIDRVADLIARTASLHTEPLSDAEAVRLEAFVAARREPEVAAALAEAQSQWRAAVQPLVDAAVADGTVDEDVDPEAVLYFVRSMHLGLLLQRGAGAPPPDPESWQVLVDRIVASFGRPSPRRRRRTT